MKLSRRAILATPLLIALPGCSRCSSKDAVLTGPLAAHAFAVVALGDDVDPFKDATGDRAPPSAELIRVENVQLGPAGPAPRRYVMIPAPKGESLDASLAPIRPWIAGIELPADHQLAWGPELAYDDTTGRPELIGWRSYLLRGKPVVDGTQVERAEVVEGQLGLEDLQITLDAAGAAALGTFTGAHLERRAALLVRGLVETAPVVKTPITGGKLRLSSGSGDAKRLLFRLGGG